MLLKATFEEGDAVIIDTNLHLKTCLKKEEDLKKDFDFLKKLRRDIATYLRTARAKAESNVRTRKNNLTIRRKSWTKTLTFWRSCRET